MPFGEGKSTRCILVYSGIHYDRVAFSLSDPPYTSSTLPPELDITKWETTDDEVLEKAKELVKQLNEIHYYTDPSEILLRCDVPGCQWIGSGEHEGRKHAEQTGHTSLSEIEDNALLKCNTPGCDWLGTGEANAKKHTSDTDHKSLSVIPDF
jgi:ubiquitin thioesterase OTU1